MVNEIYFNLVSQAQQQFLSRRRVEDAAEGEGQGETAFEFESLLKQKHLQLNNSSNKLEQQPAYGQFCKRIAIWSHQGSHTPCVTGLANGLCLRLPTRFFRRMSVSFFSLYLKLWWDLITQMPKSYLPWLGSLATSSIFHFPTIFYFPIFSFSSVLLPVVSYIPEIPPLPWSQSSCQLLPSECRLGVSVSLSPLFLFQTPFIDAVNETLF